MVVIKETRRGEEASSVPGFGWTVELELARRVVGESRVRTTKSNAGERERKCREERKKSAIRSTAYAQTHRRA